MINAKAETVAEKPAYRAASEARPCLVVADRFYEWAKIGPKELLGGRNFSKFPKNLAR
jgi:putative SOS response-associated peptidase YedK